MARLFAGVFGPLAFLTSLARGAAHGGSADSTLLAAWCGLVVFSAVGALVGWIAGRTIEESVQATLVAELAAQPTPEKAEVAGRAPESR